MRCCLGLALSTLALAQPAPETILPAPAPDVSALARAEYQRAEQEYASGNLDAAEKALLRSMDHQSHPLTRYNLALVHLKQHRFWDANIDLLCYFGDAPPGNQDPNHRQAMALLRRLKKAHEEHRVMMLRGYRLQSEAIRKQLAERPGDAHLKIRLEDAVHEAQFLEEQPQRAEVAHREAVQRIRSGNLFVGPELDTALDYSHDFSLVYWIAFSEYHSARRDRDGRLYPGFLRNMRSLLNAYFNAAEDQSEFAGAQRLADDLDRDLRRSTSKGVDKLSRSP